MQSTRRSLEPHTSKAKSKSCSGIKDWWMTNQIPHCVLRSLADPQNRRVLACRMKGAGRGAGEPPEAAWSQLGKLSHTTKSQALPTRQCTLEKQMLYTNAAKQESMPKLLMAMFSRACAGEEEAGEEILNIVSFTAAQTSSTEKEAAAQVCISFRPRF